MPNKPTARQLSSLKSLAERTGQTFTYPHTAAQASREIDRLKHPKASSRTERYIDRKQIDQIATGPAEAARVRDDEISGHGSGATWAPNRHQEPVAPEHRPAPRRVTPVVGKRTELERYTVGEGERVIYGQRIDGIVRVTDRPAGSGGRSYLVERGLETNGELQALINDYLQQATKLGQPPLSICPLV